MPFWKLSVTVLSLHLSFASSKFCSGLVSFDPFLNHFVSFQQMLNGQARVGNSAVHVLVLGSSFCDTFSYQFGSFQSMLYTCFIISMKCC